MIGSTHWALPNLGLKGALPMGAPNGRSHLYWALPFLGVDPSKAYLPQLGVRPLRPFRGGSLRCFRQCSSSQIDHVDVSKSVMRSRVYARRMRFLRLVRVCASWIWSCIICLHNYFTHLWDFFAVALLAQNWKHREYCAFVMIRILYGPAWSCWRKQLCYVRTCDLF